MLKLTKKQISLIARFFTHLFSPSTMIVVLSMLLYFTYVPNSLLNFIIWFGSTIVFLVVALLFLIVLKKNKLVSDFNVTKREERPLFFFPLLTVLIAITFLNYLRGWNEVADFLIFITFSYAIAFTITLFFKISIHVFSVTLAYMVAMMVFGNFWIILLFPIPIVTAWTRLHLKRHSFNEVVAGFILPIVLTIFWLVVTFDVTTIV